MLEILGFDNGREIYVRKIDIGQTPDALKLPDVKAAASRDPTHLEIMEAIQSGKSHTQKTPLAFKICWAKLSIIDGILHRNSKIVLPNAEAHPGSGNIRQHAIEIAHEGHQGMGVTKRHLRETLWFPMMDDMVEQLVSSCHPCQAATETKHRDPNIPSGPPSEPWQKLDTDH